MNEPSWRMASVGASCGMVGGVASPEELFVERIQELGYPVVLVTPDRPGVARRLFARGIHDTPWLIRAKPDGNNQFMSHFQTTPKIPIKTGADGKRYVDYKSTDELRRMMTPNGKIYSRKRLSASSQDQRRVSQAIKRARYMALLPYTSATL